jgi:SnoaL-like domain
VQGPTTYSWAWDRLEVFTAGAVAWLLAEGTETAATPAGEQKHPYRMTILCEKRDEQWLLLQVHGSSPHQG